jgi:hypothetical protein
VSVPEGLYPLYGRGASTVTDKAPFPRIVGETMDWSMTWMAHIYRLQAPAAEETTSVNRIKKAPQPSTIAIASAV